MIVGFGDYYAKTNFGRLIVILAGLFGMVLVSFIVVAFTNSLKFTENEFSVSILVISGLRSEGKTRIET